MPVPTAGIPRRPWLVRWGFFWAGRSVYQGIRVERPQIGDPANLAASPAHSHGDRVDVDLIRTGHRARRGLHDVVERYLSHGGNVYHAARVLSRDASDFCDFSASINPLGVPPAARRVLQTAINKIQHYPDPEGLALVQAIAERHRIAPENVLLGNGTVELIYAIPVALNVQSWFDYRANLFRI